MTDPDEHSCQRCGSELVPILYGYPGLPRIAAAECGEIALGGYTIEKGQPDRGCVACLDAVDLFA